MRLSTLLVLVCVAVLMTGASAQRSLECQKVWDGPSSNNDLVDCLKNSDRISSQWQYYIFPAVLLVIFLLTLILLPMCVCCSCCQCCLCFLCCCKVPRTKPELSKGSCWLWMLVIWEALMSIAVFVMVVYGASLLMQSVDHSLDGVESGPLTYFNQTRDNILALLVDYSTNPPTPADVDVSAFDDVTKEMHQHVEDIRSDVWKYFKIGRGVSYGIGCLGFVLTLVLFVFLCCRASGCLTIVMSYVYYVLAFLYALCGVVFALAVYFVSAFCGEVTLQYTTEPGVFQWLVVPWCKEQFDFESLRTDVLNDEKTASEAACESVLEICDNTETYNNDDKMFMCGQGITSKTQCTNFAFVAQVVETTYAKPMLNNMLCTNTAGWEYQEKCTVLECSTRCQDYSTLKPKSLSQTAILGAQYAQNASTALSYVLPMMQCDFIVNKVISAVETSSQTNSAYSYHWPSQSNCSNLRLSSILLAVGFLVGSITFVLGVHILLRARSLWTHPVPEEPKDLRLANSPVQ